MGGVGFFTGLKSVCYDFAVWSTVAAIPHIANARHTWTRIFWLIIFLVMMGIFLGQLYSMLRKFFSFPTQVTTIISYSQLPFPAVTICNLNPYKYTIVGDTANADFERIRALIDAYMMAARDNYKNSYSGGTADEWGVRNLWDRPYALETTTKDALIIEAAQLSDAQKGPALYKYDELVTECTFNSKACTSSDFTSFVDPVYGACYSFNGAGSVDNATYQSSRSGMKFGLKLLMTPTQKEPSSDPDVLPTTQLAGARVSVHQQGAFPSLEGSAISVGIGYLTAVSVTLTTTKRLKKPYGECVDREESSTDYYKDYLYSLETCYLGCKQRYNVKMCDCAHPRFASGSSQTICDFSALGCIQTLKGDQMNKTQPNIDAMNDCGCHPPCSQSDYATTTSLAAFPAAYYYVAADSSSAYAKGSCSPTTTQFAGDGVNNASKAEECRDWYAENSLLLQVFYETLNSQLYQESANYGISSVLNDLGGHAGLWLGLSIISVVEICGLFIVVCLYICGGRNKLVDPALMKEDHRIKDLDDLKNDLDHIDAHDKMDAVAK